MIEVQQLHKRFGAVTAVEDVSFQARPGEIFGLLGPNGAGKTSCLRMLYGMLAPTAGELYVDGLSVPGNVIKIQQRMGVLPDQGGLYTRLTARENIRYFGRLHGLPNKQIAQSTEKLAELLSMQDILDRPTKGFSQGERMKVALSRALVHNPNYLLLDEPTNGLDVLTTRAVRRLLLQLKAEGKCIIYSSHLMHEVEQLCDGVAIVAKGRIVASGSISAVCASAGVDELEDAFTHHAYGPENVHD